LQKYCQKNFFNKNKYLYTLKTNTILSVKFFDNEKKNGIRTRDFNLGKIGLK